MTRGRPKTYTERHRYIIRVLFLYGLTAGEIVKMMQVFGVLMSEPQVRGQIESLGYRRREMPRAVRQRLLNTLKATRLDKVDRQTPIPDYFFEAK
jgi:hypothetical protein